MKNLLIITTLITLLTIQGHSNVIIAPEWEKRLTTYKNFSLYGITNLIDIKDNYNIKKTSSAETIMQQGTLILPEEWSKKATFKGTFIRHKKAYKLLGISNGIDLVIFSPSTDPIPILIKISPYYNKDLEGFQLYLTEEMPSNKENWLIAYTLGVAKPI